MSPHTPSLPCLPSKVDSWLAGRRTDPDLKGELTDLLLRLIAIDTTPKSSAETNAQVEQQVFEVIETSLSRHCPDARFMRPPIRPEIADHPYFTLPYYMGDVSGSPIEVARRAFAGRTNLFMQWSSKEMPRRNSVGHPSSPESGTQDRRRPVLAFNAHIDTVAPYIPGRVEGDTIFGRGAVDDKGPIVSIMLAMRLLAEIAAKFDIHPSCDLLSEFVIDEESGGNGSLSAALETEQGRFNAMVVVECTGFVASPGNRGAVWYAVHLDLKAKRHSHRKSEDRDVLLEASAFVVGALSDFGRTLKTESDHPLFPHRPVQTCHGVIDRYGRHPSRVNDYIPLRIAWNRPLKDQVRTTVDLAVDEYCQLYGDKTRPETGEALLARHFEWKDLSANSAHLSIFGISGHMGSVDRLDGAITKAAFIIRKLVALRQKLAGEMAETPGNLITIHLVDRDHRNCLIQEGGQGFLPTHSLDEVCRRMREAVSVGIQAYAKLVGFQPDAIIHQTTFDKLHNDAFARPATGPAMTALLNAARSTGIYHGEPVRGWDASCDARIFARQFPDAQIITFGPGALAQAHADTEHILVADLISAAETMTRMALAYSCS